MALVCRGPHASSQVIMNNHIKSTITTNDSEPLRVFAKRKVPVIWSDCSWTVKISRIPKGARARGRLTREIKQLLSLLILGPITAQQP